MKNLPQIKVYDIDYKFIISNYTDKELWDKEWTLFIYKNYVFTLSLEQIKTRTKEIEFCLKLKSDLDIWCNSKTGYIRYAMNNMSIDFLKKLIYQKMIELTEYLESEYIESKDEMFLLVKDTRTDERERLREIAENFLDENSVTNDEIREVYIDNFINENEKIWEKLSEIQRNKKYTYLTGLYLVLANINEDVDLRQSVRNNQNEDISLLEQEINEFIENLNSEEYTEEMKENLEAI